MQPLPDVQNRKDRRGINLSKVGVTNFYHPLIIRDKLNEIQPITAKIDIFAGLHAEQRGAHLSHLIDGFNKYKSALFSMDDLVGLLRDAREKQDIEGIPIENANVLIKFKYFVQKAAPSSGIEALVAYDCGFEVDLSGTGLKTVIVAVPVSTVCPCSMEISNVGAHNQRANVNIWIGQELDDSRIIWLEDLIRIAEQSASSELYSVLRRVDEKAVTERMFAAPAFVEDVVRDTVQRLKSEVGGIRYSVSCESFESIHPHNAYAETSGRC